MLKVVLLQNLIFTSQIYLFAFDQDDLTYNPNSSSLIKQKRISSAIQLFTIIHWFHHSWQVKDIHHIIWNTDDGFEYNDKTSDNDFIILKLGSPLIFNEDIQPACLPSSKDYLSYNSTEDRCFTSGWGTLESGKL